MVATQYWKRVWVTYLQFGIVRNSAYAGALRRESNFPNAILILFQRVRGPVPVICTFR
jgi:hypothetical protein